MGVEGVGVQSVVQAHHLLLCARGVRLHDMGCGGVHDGGALVEKDDAVQTVGVAGAVDALDGLPLLLGLDGQPLHQRRFAAARPAFDEIHLHPRLPPKRLKIAFEPGGGGGAQKEINRIAAYSIHTQTPHFCYRVCKSEGKSEGCDGKGSPFGGNGDDRRQRRKQGVAVGAAASRMQATA